MGKGNLSTWSMPSAFICNVHVCVDYLYVHTLREAKYRARCAGSGTSCVEIQIQHTKAESWFQTSDTMCKYLQNQLLQRGDGDFGWLIRLQVLVVEIRTVQAVAVTRSRTARSPLHCANFEYK